MSLRFETTKELAVPDRLSLHGTEPALIEVFFEPVEDLKTRLAFLVFASHAVRVRKGVETGWMIGAECFDYSAGAYEEVGQAWIHGKQEDRPEILETVGKWIKSGEGGLWVPEQIVEMPPTTRSRADIEIKGMILTHSTSNHNK